MAVKEAPDRAGCERDAVLATEQVGEFDQGDVHLRLDGSQDYVAIRLDVVRAQIAALRQGLGPALNTPGADPTNGTRYSNAETLRRPIARQPVINRGDHTVP
jgi:hypothetical protein